MPVAHRKAMTIIRELARLPAHFDALLRNCVVSLRQILVFYCIFHDNFTILWILAQ